MYVVYWKDRWSLVNCVKFSFPLLLMLSGPQNQIFRGWGGTLCANKRKGNNQTFAITCFLMKFLWQFHLENIKTNGILITSFCQIIKWWSCSSFSLIVQHSNWFSFWNGSLLRTSQHLNGWKCYEKSKYSHQQILVSFDQYLLRTLWCRSLFCSIIKCVEQVLKAINHITI